jgi:hypothetical protein
MKTGKQLLCHFSLLIGFNEYLDSIFDSIPQITHNVLRLESVLTEYDYEVRTFHSFQLDPEGKPAMDTKLQDKLCIFFM